MIDDPVFRAVSTDSELIGLLGPAPIRCYPSGMAPKAEQRPYVVFQQSTGFAENQVDQPPDIDQVQVTIECWAVSLSAARRLAKLVRGVLEPLGHVAAYFGDEKDAETGLYGVTFAVDFYVER